MIGNIITDVIQSIVGLIRCVCAMLLYYAAELFGTSKIGSIEYVAEIVGDDYNQYGLHLASFTTDSGNLGALISLFQRVGIVTVFVLLFVHMVLISFSSATSFRENKDSIKTLLIRSVIALFLVTAIPSIEIQIWNQFDKYNSNFFDNAFSDWEEPETSFMKYCTDVATATDTANEEYPDYNSTNSVAVFGATTMSPQMTVGETQVVLGTLAGLCLGILLGIISIFLFAAIAYNYIKLCIEFINRFVKAFVMFIFSPAVCATYSSASTENIFFTYIKTFATQILLLIITKFYLQLGLKILNVMECNLINAFIMIAFLNLGQKLDQFLKELGFSASSTGGSLLDSMMQSLHNLDSLARFGGAIVGGAGAAMITAGALSNNMALGKAGSLLRGNGIKDADVMSQMNSTMGNSINKMMHGGNEKVGHGQYAAMDNLFRHSGDRNNRDQFLTKLNSMNAADTGDYLNHLMSDVLGKGNIKNALGMPANSELSFDNLGIDGQGNLHGTVNTPLGSLGEMVLSTDAMKGEDASFIDNGGNEMHMAFNGASFDGHEITGSGIAMSELMDQDAYENGYINTANPICSVAGFAPSEVNDLRDMVRSNPAMSCGFDDLRVASSSTGTAEIGAIYEDSDGYEKYQPILHTSPSGAHYYDAAFCEEYQYTGNEGLAEYKEKYMNYDSSTGTYNMGSDLGRVLKSQGINEITSVDYIDQTKGGIGGYKVICKNNSGDNVTLSMSAASLKDPGSLNRHNIYNSRTCISVMKDPVKEAVENAQSGKGRKRRR